MMTGKIAAPLLQALVGDEEVAAFFSDDAELAAMLRFEAALAEAEADGRPCAVGFRESNRRGLP